MPKPRIRCNAGGALTDDSGTPAPIPMSAQTSVLIKAPAPTQAPVPTLALALASVLGPPGRYTNEDLQKATMLALESFVKGQEHGQL